MHLIVGGENPYNQAKNTVSAKRTCILFSPNKIFFQLSLASNWTKIWSLSLSKLKLLCYFSHNPLRAPVVGGVRVVHLFRFVFIFFLVCLRPVSLCTQCCQCLWNVHSWLPLRFSLKYIFCESVHDSSYPSSYCRR
jgi:hypothetical protein